MVTKIIIAEDNTFAFSCYQNFLSKDKTIEIVGHAQDGELAVKMYKEKNPDLLILDLNLPKKNGLEVLEDLAIFEGEKPKCNVIVVSGESNMLHQLLKTRKVIMKIEKPTTNEKLLSVIKDFQNEQALDSFSESKCNDLFLKLNLNPYSKNGRLLAEAIRSCYCNYELLDNMNLLYSTLGYRKSCSPQKIKSSLRSIISSANRLSNFDTLNCIFLIETEDIKKGISPKHFINGIIACLKK